MQKALRRLSQEFICEMIGLKAENEKLKKQISDLKRSERNRIKAEKQEENYQ